MKPAVGAKVTMRGYIANGSDTHPGEITKVHGAGEGALCAVTVHPAGHPDKEFAAIPVYSSRAAARDDIPGATLRHNGYAYLQEEGQ
ncbi:hypothetical protein [Cupriavidus alkaliphilus]|uniref:Uncharacterized protein n=1 Tax=Cupriavidus alkaliphilus TaxID=942866 RepID=A0A7W4YTF2_9BURK|nr:hypothetical protein [Cupriavidus alkaliphilus]MBB3010648.1 hypothetical protein [Cupriavidus alkaliphilus]